MAFGFFKKLGKGISNAWNKAKDWVKNGGVSKVINTVGNIANKAGQALGLVKDAAGAAGLNTDNAFFNGANNVISGVQNTLGTATNVANKLNLLA